MKRSLALLILLGGAVAVERRIEAVTHARLIAHETGTSYWQLLAGRAPLDLLDLWPTPAGEAEEGEENLG